MKLIAISSALVVASAGAKRFDTWGPVFTVSSEGLAPKGVEDLNLKGEWSADVTPGVSTGVKYDVNISRNTPSSIWLATSGEVDDDGTIVSARAEYDVKSRATVLEARVSRGDDEASIDFDTNTNEPGPLRLRKSLDFGGRRVTLRPKLDLRRRTGELKVQAEVDADVTTAELTLNHDKESAQLEVNHRLDDYNVLSPKVDLKTGDLSVRLNRALEGGGLLEVTADKRNVDWEIQESGGWTVKGNIPLEDTASSAISFKRTINLS